MDLVHIICVHILWAGTQSPDPTCLITKKKGYLSIYEKENKIWLSWTVLCHRASFQPQCHKSNYLFKILDSISFLPLTWHSWLGSSPFSLTSSALHMQSINKAKGLGCGSLVQHLLDRTKPWVWSPALLLGAGWDPSDLVYFRAIQNSDPFSALLLPFTWLQYFLMGLFYLVS